MFLIIDEEKDNFYKLAYLTPTVTDLANDGLVTIVNGETMEVFMGGTHNEPDWMPIDTYNIFATVSDE